MDKVSTGVAKMVKNPIAKLTISSGDTMDPYMSIPFDNITTDQCITKKAYNKFWKKRSSIKSNKKQKIWKSHFKSMAGLMKNIGGSASCISENGKKNLFIIRLTSNPKIYSQ